MPPERCLSCGLFEIRLTRLSVALGTVFLDVDWIGSDRELGIGVEDRPDDAASTDIFGNFDLGFESPRFGDFDGLRCANEFLSFFISLLVLSE